MNEQERAQALDEIERWAASMQMPMLRLRAAVGATKAGIVLPEGRAVEDELETVVDGFARMPIALLSARPLRPLSTADVAAHQRAERAGALDALVIGTATAAWPADELLRRLREGEFPPAGWEV